MVRTIIDSTINHKNKIVSFFFTNKDEFIWGQQEIAIWDMQAIAKQQASPENREEHPFIEDREELGVLL